MASLPQASSFLTLATAAFSNLVVLRVITWGLRRTFILMAIERMSPSGVQTGVSCNRLSRYLDHRRAAFIVASLGFFSKAETELAKGSELNTCRRRISIRADNASKHEIDKLPYVEKWQTRMIANGEESGIDMVVSK